MAEFLVFTLTASLAAMGELAGQERRGSLTMPGRSAVLGLVAAALGMRRDEPERLASLEALSVGIGLYEEGQPLRDFHTVQTVPSARAKNPATRADALKAGGLGTNTVITLRDYRSGVHYAVALAGAGLDAIEEALKAPVFTLYFGRKSCPLSSRPMPRRVMAESAVEALKSAEIPAFLKKGDAVPALKRVALDAVLAEGLPSERVLRETRSDQMLDRRYWHFSTRTVHLYTPEVSA